jgi:hypothetical protein
MTSRFRELVGLQATRCPIQCYAAGHHLKCWEKKMPESGEIAVRLTVLEIVVRQLITHMAVRNDDPARWVETRKTLARRAIQAEAPWQADRLISAVDALFDQAEAVACDYGAADEPATPEVLTR